MAFNVNQGYNGNSTNEYMRSAILSANSIDKGYVRLLEGIKYKTSLQTLNLNNIVQDGNCRLTEQGDVTLGDIAIEPKPFGVKIPICIDTFRTSWGADNMQPGAKAPLTPEFIDAVIDQIVLNIAKDIELNIWQGTDTPGKFNGIQNTILSNLSQVPVSQRIAGVQLTPANIIDEMTKLVLACPTEVLTSDKKLIYLSPKAHLYYTIALGGFATNGTGANGIGGNGTNTQTMPSWMATFQVASCNGISDDVMFISYPDNFIFGTDLKSDTADITINDLRKEGDNVVEFTVRYNAGTTVMFFSDVVTYGLGV